MRSDSQSRRDVIDLFAEIRHGGAEALQTIPGFTAHGWPDSGSAGRGLLTKKPPFVVFF